MQLDLRAILLCFVFAVLISIALHVPPPYGNPSMYSDINALYNDIFLDFRTADQGGRWYIVPTPNLEIAIPYVHYKFEYPPVIGAIWYITTTISNCVSKESDERLLINYLLQSIIILYVALMLITDLIDIAKYLGLRFQPLYVIAVPSIILFTTYNWDIIAIAMAMRGLRYVLVARYFYGGFFAGLALSTKIIPGAMILPVIIELYYSRKIRDAMKFVGGCLLGGIAPYLVLMTMAPRGFADFISHHTSWYLENSWYVMFTDNIWDEGLRSLAQALMALSIVISLFIPLKGSLEMRVLIRSWIATSSLLFFSYVYTPQMNLLLLPYIALLNIWDPLLIYLFDFLNALIILMWFSLDKWCSVLNLTCEGGPWVRTSPTQWAAFARCILLAVIILYTLRVWCSRSALLSRRSYEEA